jgi:transposase
VVLLISADYAGAEFLVRSVFSIFTKPAVRCDKKAWRNSAEGRRYMLWIAGSVALVLFGTVLMCILTVGGRVDDRMELTKLDDRMELTKLIEPSIRLPFSAQDKIRVVLEGFQNQIPVSDLCKRKGISPALYYSWVNDFIDAGKARLNGDSLRNATQSGFKELEGENVVLNFSDV